MTRATVGSVKEAWCQFVELLSISALKIAELVRGG